MDLRVYYQKLHETEQGIPGDSVVVVSLATPDGGKAGVYTEVSRRNAARLVVEGRAQVASPDDAGKFRQGVAQAKAAAEEAEAARKVEIMVVSGTDSKKTSFKPSKV